MGKYLLVAFFLSVLFLFQPVSAQEGEIYALSISPSEPHVSEPTSISVGIKNPGSFKLDYKLQVLIIKEGSIADEIEYSFTLRPNQGTFLSPTFYPNDIGEFDVLVRLFDELEIKLIDSKFEKFVAVSDVGPFDLFLDVPTDVIGPSQILPLIVTAANMGERGTDVEIKIELQCLNQSKIENTFFVFLNRKSTVQQLTSIPTCEQEGLHNIFAHIILFNKILMTSVSQIIINKSHARISIELPEEMELERAKTKTFDVSVENLGTNTIHNLRLLIEKIPMPWVSVSPASIVEVKPNQTVIFIVSITVPNEASLDTYPIKVSAAADEFLTRSDSKIKILRAAALPVEPATAPTFFDSLYLAVSQNFITISSVGVAAVAVVFAAKTLRERKRRRVAVADKVKRVKTSVTK